MKTDKTEKLSRTNVTVVSKKGETALVQYMLDGVLNRKYIPVKELGNGYVLDTVLDKGIPYGHPWDEINLTFDSNRFAHEMRQVGLWTVEDAMKSPQKLWSALNATLSDNVSNILKTAKLEIRSKHND